jgi:DNA-binding IclR family transcriptional regulator
VSEGRRTSGSGSAGIAAVERTMAIIETLVESRDGALITELATRLGLDKSTVLRIVSGLEHAGYVSRDQRTGTCHLTFKLIALANRHAGFLEVHDLSLPTLNKLAAATGELVELAIVDNGSMVFVAKVDGRSELSSLRVISGVGQSVRLHTMSAGKVWLASLPESEALTLAVKQGLSLRTPHSITDVMQLRRGLAEVRKKGYALNLEEDSLGVNAVAVPVHARSAVVGAVVVAAPSSRAARARLEAMAPQVRAAGEELSQVWPIDRALKAQPRDL